MPRSSKSADRIDWASSESKLIVVKDLEDGKLSLDESNVSAEMAWMTLYREHPKFVLEGVCFSQFKERLKDHRKQVEKRAQKVSVEVAALVHDQLRSHPQFRKTSFEKRGSVLQPFCVRFLRQPLAVFAEFHHDGGYFRSGSPPAPPQSKPCA